MSETPEDAARWLRARGLPSFVAPRARGAMTVARTAPFLVLVICAETLGWMLDRTVVSIDASAFVAGLVLIAFSAMTVMVLVVTPIAAFWVSARWVGSWPRGMTAAGWMLISYDLFVAPWLGAHPEPLAGTARAALLVAVALLATRFGAGSLLSWALRSAVRQLRALPQLTSRALPLLMLVVVVSFFSRALWEVADTMTFTRLAGFIALFVLLGLFFIVPVTRAETAGLENPGTALSRTERLNVTVVMVLAQGVQVVIFAVLVCVFLVVLGWVAFTPALLDAWLGPHRAVFEVLGVPLPVDAVLVKTAAVLSCVSSLNFLVSATSNAAYRSAFYDPLFEDARVALVVRAAHLAPLGRETAPEIVVKRE